MKGNRTRACEGAYAQPQTLRSHWCGTDYDADAIFVVVNRDDGAQKLYQQIQSSPIWQGLKAVKANHVYAIPDQPWVDYSALGSKMALDDAEKMFAK